MSTRDLPYERGLEHYERLFGRREHQPSRYVGALDRSSLPTPLQYLSQHRMLTRETRGKWAQVKCPVHKGGDERHPSMSVSLVDGHFTCHACGAKGGDIVKLHMLATGMRFPAAVRDLGGRFHG